MIRQRLDAVEKLEIEEGIRHAKEVKRLQTIVRAIQNECTHSRTKMVQTSIEQIEVCEDCDKMIL